MRSTKSSVQPDNIPKELKRLSQWVCWKSVGTKKNPYTPGKHLKAKTNNKETWRDFKTALSWYRKNSKKYDGIGFVFTADDPYCGIDLDEAYDPDTGKIIKNVLVVKSLSSYTELSPSGKGLHIIIKAELPPEARKKEPKKKFEIYCRERFFTFTGKTMGYTSIKYRQEKIDIIHRSIFREDYGKEKSDLPTTPDLSGVSDDTIIQKIYRAKNGAKFGKLMAGEWEAFDEYPSESEADMALCGIIAFYTQDKDQILRIIQKSKLWDEKWKRKNYQDGIINKVLKNLKDKYDWSKEKTTTEPRSEEKSGLLTAGELLKRDRPRPDMIIGHGLLPYRGYTVLVSSLKEGKTALAMQMCLSIISGKEFLGFPIEQETPILFFHLADTDQDIKELLKRQTQGMKLPAGTLDSLYPLAPLEGLHLQGFSSISYIREKIEETKAGLIVIDPVSLTIDYDIKKAKTKKSLVEYTKDIEASWLFIKPYEKSTRSKLIKEIALDNSGWGHQYSSFIGIEQYNSKCPSEYKRLILKPSYTKQSRDLCIYLNPETGLFKVVDPNSISKISTDTVAKILEEQDSPIQHKDLLILVQKKTGRSERAARSLIAKAKTEGKVKKGGGKFGLYSI